MPSDSKKKRDLQKKAAAKQRQAQSTKKNNTTNAASADDNNQNEEDFIEDNDDGEIQDENENPSEQTNGSTNVVDPNVKSLIQNLDLLAMVEKANADARSCTGNK